jgi:hypothetical protein
VSFQTTSVGWAIQAGATKEEGDFESGRVGYLGPKRGRGLRLEHLQEVLDDVLGLLPEQHAVIRRALDQVVRGILAFTDIIRRRAAPPPPRERGDRRRRRRRRRRRTRRVDVPSSKDFSSFFWCVSLA